MKDHETVDCSYLVNYLTGDGTEFARTAFERHLRTCVTCREELSDLQAVWQALPFDMEVVEVPADLKQQVMQHITQNLAVQGEEKAQPELVGEKDIDEKQEQQQQQKQKQNAKQNQNAKQKRSYMWVYGVAAAMILGLAAGMWWDSLRKPSTVIANPGLQQPAEIVRTYQFKSVESTMPTASGTAYVLQNGDVHNVVINLQGLQATHGDWAYQVWFNRNGKRYNCGTLRVDEKGMGVLTYSLPAKMQDVQIDSFGVTLEPDANGVQPRGKKILGTT